MLSGITIDVPCPAAHRRTRFRSTATRCSTRRSYRRSLRGTLCPRITRSPMGHLLSAIAPSRRSSTRPFRAVRPRRDRRRRQHRLLGPVLAKGRTRSVLLSLFAVWASIHAGGTAHPSPLPRYSGRTSLSGTTAIPLASCPAGFPANTSPTTFPAGIVFAPPLPNPVCPRRRNGSREHQHSE